MLVDEKDDLEPDIHLSFFESHLLRPTAFSLDVQRLRDPAEKQLASRGLNPLSLEEMKRKIKVKGFWPQHPLVCVTFAFGGRRPPNPSASTMLDSAVYVISGNHRRAALTALC